MYKASTGGNARGSCQRIDMECEVSEGLTARESAQSRGGGGGRGEGMHSLDRGVWVKPSLCTEQREPEVLEAGNGIGQWGEERLRGCGSRPCAG